MQVLCPSLGGREPDYHKRKLHTEVDNAISLKLKIINSIFTSPGDWEPDYDKQCTKKKKIVNSICFSIHFYQSI